MLISIVIPVYNVEKYISHCLDSIIPQIKDRDDIEVILVDDGSSDKSGIICDRYKNLYSNFIKVFHRTNHGLLLTRLFGYEHANGEYIINCDSDDLLEPFSIEKLSKIMIEKSPDVIIYNSNIFDNNKKQIFFENIFTNNKFVDVDKELVIREFLTSHKIVSMCMKCFKRNCINYNEEFMKYASIQNGEDTLLSTVIFENSNTFMYLNEALYNYRTGSGMTSRFDKDFYKSFKKNYMYILNSSLVKDNEEHHMLILQKYFTSIGRAITQSRFNKDMTFNSRKQFLKEIRCDQLFQENVNYFKFIKPTLKRSYRILDYLLVKNQYLVIHLFLKMKNFLSK